PTMQVTLFSWNEKYILKFETPMFEQTYKVKSLDIISEADVIALVDNPDFLAKVEARFLAMQSDWELAVY
ncbi:MAG: hypothetical protein ACOVMN_11785, partial [Flexibacteraceae bacterium]